MDELTAVSRRLLGDEAAAAGAAAAAGETGDRAVRLAATLQACRDARPVSGEDPPSGDRARGGSGDELRAAVSRELTAAVAAVSEREQEAMALRDVAGLSHAEIAAVLSVEPAAATALLTRARLAFRAALRGAPTPEDGCAERDRALRLITLRLDREAVPAGDEDWLIEHLGACPGCRRAHASLLEAAACYRSWPAPEPTAA